VAPQAAPLREKPQASGSESRIISQARPVVQLAAAKNTEGATANLRQVAAITISIAPTPVSLMESQTQQFTPTLTGTINTRVAWTLSPSIGTVDGNGVYTAPATISSAQTVTVTATSAADTTKSASATVNLIPVAVSLGPATVTMGASQTQQFTASVSGAANGAVTWSLNPAVGTINNGLYTAPATICYHFLFPNRYDYRHQCGRHYRIRERCHKSSSRSRGVPEPRDD
jgi:hypothetical protein